MGWSDKRVVSAHKNVKTGKITQKDSAAPKPVRKGSMSRPATVTDPVFKNAIKRLFK